MSIQTLGINNFKSIKHLEIECGRVNLFIGKPNTGKSNLLEALAFFSLSYALGIHNLDENRINKIKKFIRFQTMYDFFYDHEVGSSVEIETNIAHGEIKLKNGSFLLSSQGQADFSFAFNDSGLGQDSKRGDSPFKYYRFSIVEQFQNIPYDFLLPPDGRNLFLMLDTKKDFRKLIGRLVGEFGYELVLRRLEQQVEIQKKVEEVVVSFPYFLLSDTLQRLIFHLGAMETNRDSILLFEEPEAHAFPYYTKYLGELIAMDQFNQYFITTHNPYILSSILEKSTVKDTAIFVTYFEDYQTKVRQIPPDRYSKILDMDASVFFNLEQFLNES
ncbi:MAG: AAA family ATPase [Candidatus Eremiobacteraeota bacterium]|nr:AAA family ATPase [Candidatus Eremiobacteraeota bacterium]MCL5055297.1 AAA family ATPase [Bacillota bacterium]